MDWADEKVHEWREANRDLLGGLYESPAFHEVLAVLLREVEGQGHRRHASWNRKPTHGPCCTCQKCGQFYDDCRCELDEVAAELEQAQEMLGACVSNCEGQQERAQQAEAQLAEARAEVERLSRGQALMLDDLASLLRALGLGDHARPETPHFVMLSAIADVERLRADLHRERHAQPRQDLIERADKAEAALAASQAEVERWHELLRDELGTNLRIAQRLGFWTAIESGKSYEDAEVEVFERLQTEVDRLKSGAVIKASLEAVVLAQRAQQQAEAALAAEREGIRRFASGEQVGVSTGIDDKTTYGYGLLDDNGFWGFPVPPALVKVRTAERERSDRLRALLVRFVKAYQIVQPSLLSSSLLRDAEAILRDTAPEVSDAKV